MTDEYLMELVAKGDLDKLSILFKKYHLNLYNFFLNRRHDASVCQDLSQNVFERILKYRTSYKAIHPFKAWFFRIARNVEADYFKQQKIKIDDHAELHNMNFLTQNILDKIEQKDQKTKIQQALSMLNLEEQELLHFSKFQKLKSYEIAETMNLTESAVRVKIHRAMKKLKIFYFKIEAL